MPASTSRPPSTTSTAGRTSGTAYEKIAADVIARYKRLAGFDDALRDGQRRALAERLPQGARSWARIRWRTAIAWRQEFRDVWRRARHLVRRLHPDDRAAAQGAASGAGPAHHAPPATSTRASTKGWYCVGVRGVQAGEGPRRRRCARSTARSRDWIQEKNYFFRLVEVSASRCSTHFAAHPEFLVPDIRRNEILRLLEAGSRTSRSAGRGQSWGIPLPYDPRASSMSGSTRSSTTSRRSASAPTTAAVREVVAGRSARDRQGHHAVPHRDLARDADERRACACRGRCSVTAG